MFDKFKSMGALASLMQNKGKVQEAAARVKRELAGTRVTGEGGGGAVRVTVAGDMTVLDVEFSPALAAGLSASDSARDYAQSLIRDATNQALAKARDKMKEIMKREADAMGVGDLVGDSGLESFLR